MSFSSCNSTKKNIVSKTPSLKYEVVEIPLIYDEDTLYVNELRLYNIQSALDAKVIMYYNYGKWDLVSSGKYQDNIKEHVWKRVKLLENEGAFFVSADGTETLDEYFASLIIVDTHNNDCLNPNYPLRNELIDLFVRKLANVKANRYNYDIFW